MYSSVVDVGVGGAIALSSVAKGVGGSDDTSSEFKGNSAPSSTSLNFVIDVSFSSLINSLKVFQHKLYKKNILLHNLFKYIILHKRINEYIQCWWTTFGKETQSRITSHLIVRLKTVFIRANQK